MIKKKDHEESSSHVSEQSWEKEPFLWIKHNHLKKNIIGNLDKDMRLIKRVTNQVLYMCYLSHIEPKKVDDALLDENGSILYIQN